MLPLVYPLLSANPVITGLVGDRIYRHGSAPEKVTRPYITWYLALGRPEIVVNATPCVDFDAVRIDCWSESDAQVETLAYAVRSTLDSAGIANRIALNMREIDTKLYRITLDVDFILPR